MNNKFFRRHIGISEKNQNEMLQDLGFKSMDDFMKTAIPKSVYSPVATGVGKGVSEHDMLRALKLLAEKNKLFKNYIGLGYFDTYLPTVIQRNVLENPGWYTAYTPYQAEISQGRLEALLNFQTMVSGLTGLDIANASLLDEATAAAEAMGMVYRYKKFPNKKILLSKDCYPQTLDVIQTRAESLGIKLAIHENLEENISEDYFAILLQYPTLQGDIHDLESLIKKAKKHDLSIIIVADLLSLTLIKSPGDLGADIAVGSTQRFGLGLGYGGPHSGYFSAQKKYARYMPGRIIGVSLDANHNKALRMVLQTREQHIKKEKATSNICTAQALLAIISSFYAIYHGPEGLRSIAEHIYTHTHYLVVNLLELGCHCLTKFYFDTVWIQLPAHSSRDIFRKEAEDRNVNFYYPPEKADVVGISLNETIQKEDVVEIIDIFTNFLKKEHHLTSLLSKTILDLPEDLRRNSLFMQESVFHKYRSETEMLRYIRYLEKRDISLTSSMIPLGSCTMKLNASTSMLPITWPNFSAMHPFAPINQAEGYQIIISELSNYLAKITELPCVSLQPNSGAQGEYAGLLAIRGYFKSKNDYRNIALIPTSAHGTNFASASMAGMEVLTIACDTAGSIVLDDLRSKLDKYKGKVACIILTYPSTYGIFDEDIKDICSLVHDEGALVYIDGANMNAQISYTSPGSLGADLCHLNLHKTFSIPHGGGGPGMGPICVQKFLEPFLPKHVFIDRKDDLDSYGAVSSAPWGSASILIISYVYIRLLGDEGLKRSTEIAILNANYIKYRLDPFYEVLFCSDSGFVAHELIIDFRPFKKEGKVFVEDVAKRLMDYNFHAPTISWPVLGTMMIEPTESESKEELDRFCDAMISIRKEIELICSGDVDKENNILKNAPHTLYDVLHQNDRGYSLKKAIAPLSYVESNKYWPTVNRIDQAYGDRNLVCSCGGYDE